MVMVPRKQPHGRQRHASEGRRLGLVRVFGRAPFVPARPLASLAVTVVVAASMLSMGSTIAEAQSQTRITSSAPATEQGRATPPSAAACASRYHAALQRVRTGEVAGLLTAYEALGEADTALAGRWQFAASGSDEGRVRASLDALVKGRGASPDYRSRGRLGWLVRRIAYDFARYTAQAEHPALCTGTMEMLAFYNDRLAPLHRRREEVAATLEEARTLALDSWSRLATARATTSSPIAAPSRTSDSTTGPAMTAPATAAPALTGAATATSTETGAPQPAASSPLANAPPTSRDTATARATLERVSADRLAGELARAALDALAGDTTPVTPAAAITLDELATLIQAVASLGEGGKGSGNEVRDAARSALAAVETLLYAERHASTLDGFRTRLLTTMDAVADAHMIACTCRP
jgi:hypothetical protein